MKWHREMVGGLWDEIGLLQFNYLCQQGLLPSHYLLDIGCGSLRGGIHFIRFLENRHYFGIERNQELLNAGVEYELKPQNLSNEPILRVMEDFNFTVLEQQFDFALAQSVFTHLPWNSILRCLLNVRKVLKPTGKFFATFFEQGNPSVDTYLAPVQHQKEDGGATVTQIDSDPFHYPFNVFHELAGRSGLQVTYLGDWNHPRHQMMMQFAISQ